MSEIFEECAVTDVLARAECRSDSAGSLKNSQSHPSGNGEAQKSLCQVVSHDEIVAFTDQLLSQPEEKVTRQFLAYLESDYTVSTVFGSLLGGSAHELGERWVSDACSFGEVALGMAIIHRLLRRYSDALSGEVPSVAGNPVVLVTPLPGEAHIFSAALIAEYFRAGGWRVHSGIHAKLGGMMSSLTERHVDIAAVSVSNGSKIGEAGRLVSRIRRCSKNRNIRVLVGGPPFVSDPDLHLAVGADATASDAVTALRAAVQLAEF